MKKILLIGTGIGIIGFAAILATPTDRVRESTPAGDVRSVVVAPADKTPGVDQKAMDSPPSGTSALSGSGGHSIPDIPDSQAVQAEVDLWQVDQSNPDTLFDGNPAKRLHSNPRDIATFHAGQKLRLQIPQRGAAVEALIASTHNLTPHTQVWQGEIKGGHPQDNIVVTRGQVETHITIATIEGTYSAIIDNATGDTVMVDEADITANQVPYEDGIAVDPLDHQPPPIVP